ncbi:MAG TPA: neutral zinc metallopeptidase [Polyangiaceae bacterium]|jgi:predicted metalloprotease|nr:neutral zinc metallopeptidase [Polyangiaceae bacterium]
MRVPRGYKSSQVDDRRGEQLPAGGGGLSAGGANLLGLLFRRFGLPGVLVGAALLYFASRSDPGGGAVSSRSHSGSAQASAELTKEQPVVEFVSFVFDDAQNTWKEQFGRESKPYQLARLELFRRRIRSACGLGEDAMGPFYCPGDGMVYIDLSFYDQLKHDLGAPGDFAQAYVIAHEVGHHVQHLLGTDQKVHGASRAQQSGDGGLLVRLELQADCYAGIWAHGTDRRDLLEVGDVEEALNAAGKIGDDTLQRSATGVVRPESFTHGSSAQRQRWFQRGYSSGQRSACDTFSADPL